MTTLSDHLRRIHDDDGAHWLRQRRIAAYEKVVPPDEHSWRRTGIDALRSQPRDLFSREVLADWLEERGDDEWVALLRAEVFTEHDANLDCHVGCMYICESCHTLRDFSRVDGRECPKCRGNVRKWRRRDELRTRAAELLAKCRARITMQSLPKEWQWDDDAIHIHEKDFHAYQIFHRVEIDFDLGIPSLLRCRSEELLAHGATIFAALPSITRCELTTEVDREEITRMIERKHGGMIMMPVGIDMAMRFIDAEFKTPDGKPQIIEWKLPTAQPQEALS